MNVVLLGGDLNAYSVAIAFHSAYNVKSTVFSRYRCGITAASSIVDLRVEPDILDDSFGVSILLRYASNMKERPYLVACGDWYVAFLVRNREKIAEAYRFLIPSSAVYHAVSDKANFYSLLEKAQLPYPKTVILSREDLSLSRFLAVGAYPAVLKPSNSVRYYENPFPDMEKVYFPQTPRQALDIAERIFASGYKDRLILQERVGDGIVHPTAKTLTLLSDAQGRVRRGCLGEVLIEESAPGARGNYAAILTRPPDALTCRLVSFLESLGYVGIATFDILFFSGKPYVLELNPRQGRSCDYLRVSGINLAQFIVEAIDKCEMQTDLSVRAGAWHAVPFRVVLRNAPLGSKHLLLRLKRGKRTFSPFSYTGERITLRRCLYLPIHAVRRTCALKSKKEK